MKAMGLALVLFAVACSSSARKADAPVLEPRSSPAVAAEPATEAPAEPTERSPAERLEADTPRTTVEGNAFIAPAGWSIRVSGPATILEAPEGDSWIALVDVQADDPDDAIAKAWAAYQPEADRPLVSVTSGSDKDGWVDQRTYAYQTSPKERRSVVAGTMRHGERWTVWIYDVSDPTGGKRRAQVSLIFGRLLPKGYERETFAGRKANQLDDARIVELGAFVERAQKALGVPGVAVGLIQDGKVVFAGGFGVRELGKGKKVDAKTLFMIASNTKSLTTLMLGKLVEENRLAWDTPVTEAFPKFKLGSEETTSQVLVKHLVCACTGLPRQDLEILFDFESATPASALGVLGTMQPTTGFGELFQYSNPLAAAGGFVGGHILYPKLELGAAYDRAMKTKVFGPLGMRSTTFDFRRALRGNHATAHGLSIDDEPDFATMEVNYAIDHVRPAGGAWSNVDDLLKYVAMELANGKLPNGKRYISEAVLAERRTPQVPIGKDVAYGMGLIVETTYGTPVVQHGGSLIGYKSNMMWLPEHGVGAVVLTNSEQGGAIHSSFERKLLEVLFDGRPEADSDVAAAAKAVHDRIAAARKLLTVPAVEAEADKLAAKYANEALGEITVIRSGGATTFDFGEWKSPVATRKNPDGTVSFITTAVGVNGFDLIPGEADGKRTLTVRDAQHSYTFVEK